MLTGYTFRVSYTYRDDCIRTKKHSWTERVWVDNFVVWAKRVFGVDKYARQEKE
jgi:hypothetical protein